MGRSLALLWLLAGCTSPMRMEAADLDQLGPDEGRVFGSIRVDIAPASEDDAWLQGRKASGFEYGFELEPVRGELELSLAPATYEIAVDPEREKGFALKLPAGRYRFTRMFQEGFSNLETDVRRGFEVGAGQTLYVGRLVAVLPHRLALGTVSDVRVEDGQAEAGALFGAEYQDLLAGATKAVMVDPGEEP
jgi:hypothetical protein